MGKKDDRRAEAEKRDRLLHLLLIIMTVYDQWMMGIGGGGSRDDDIIPALDMCGVNHDGRAFSWTALYRRMAECFELLGYHGRYCLNSGQYRSVNEKISVMNGVCVGMFRASSGELHELVTCTKVLSFMLSVLVQATHESRRLRAYVGQGVFHVCGSLVSQRRGHGAGRGKHLCGLMCPCAGGEDMSSLLQGALKRWSVLRWRSRDQNGYRYERRRSVRLCRVQALRRAPCSRMGTIRDRGATGGGHQGRRDWNRRAKN